jgi:anaerobic magnesium-protoporphyrin IX monomethyl ester cyclase
MTTLLATLNAKYIHTNLAIRLLYQLNKARGDLAWKEFTIKEDPDAVAAYCCQYEIVAFSCYIWNIRPTLEVARRIKARRPEVKILLGGPEVSYDWQEVIAQDCVDYIITGEGETPFRLFLERFPQVENIPNLVWKDAQGTHYFQETAPFDLSAYEEIMPYTDDDPEQLPHRVLYVETSRGCPYKCEFCLASLDNKVRYLPQKHIDATLLYLMKNGRTIKFLDRTFNIKRDFTIRTFQFILDHHRPENVFQFEITADILHPDIVQFIQERIPPGLLRFEIGIQTVNQTANLAVSRKQNFDKTQAVIESLRHKIEMHLDLIVGLPHDYWEDTKNSFETVFHLFPPEFQLGFLKFLKGTPMLYKHAEHGYRFDPDPPYQIIESNYLSRDELFRIEMLEHALEIYWNKKRAPHTLRYAAKQYSIFDFLLALGQHFGETNDFHHYDLQAVFDRLADFAAANYPEDKILQELIAVDYYLYHKINPKTQFLDEIPRSEKFNLLEARGLNPNKFRFKVLPLSFDFNTFKKTDQIVQTPSLLILKYNGVQTAEVVY